jgi:hypothetical protein
VEVRNETLSLTGLKIYIGDIGGLAIDFEQEYAATYPPPFIPSKNGFIQAGEAHRLSKEVSAFHRGIIVLTLMERGQTAAFDLSWRVYTHDTRHYRYYDTVSKVLNPDGYLLRQRLTELFHSEGLCYWETSKLVNDMLPVRR